MPKRNRKPKRKTLIRKLDSVFSVFTRTEHATPDGLNRCCTCDVRKHWKSLQCGHFMSRQYYATRWERTNVGPQCRACNLRSGEQYEMGKRINLLHGAGHAEALQRAAKQPTRMKDSEIMELLDKYTAKALISCRKFH